MKKSINLRFVFIAVIAIVLTLFMTSYVFYGLLKKEVIDELKTYTELLLKNDNVGKYIDETEPILEDDKFRITVIDEQGSVLYDNNVLAESMDSHLDRPEVLEALKNGRSEIIRKSETLGINTFYYAVRLDNGSVLRVAKETDSIWSIFFSAFPLIGVITIILIVFCVILANTFTKSFVGPIESMANDIENMADIVTYKEMMPFINTIQKQHDDIVKSAKMREEFTANVSHELKTPLTAISGYAELIKSEMASEDDVTRFAGEIHRNSNRLLTLINDIIKLSQLDSSELALVFKKLDLYEVTKTCMNMLEVNAKKHNVNLYVTGSSAFIYAEKVKIEEIIFNLCDNAIQYNNENGTVHISVTDEEDGICLTVKDTGIGISLENQERIFERFYRVDKSRSKSTGGTGLGLAIVKHIVAHHNADMKLESEKGRGTTIKIVFPHIEKVYNDLN